MPDLSPRRALLLPFYLAARLFFVFRSWWVPWQYLFNRRAVRFYEETRSPLDTTEERIAHDLRTDGVAVTSLGELFPDDPTAFGRLLAHLANTRTHAKVTASKAFFSEAWGSMPRLSNENPFLPLMLHPRVVRIVNSYMRLASVFYYFALVITTPVPSGTPPQASQRWHRDPEDKRMVKMFIYLTDVTDDAGPFVYVRGSQYGGRYGRVAPQRPPRGSNPLDEVIKHAVEVQDVRVFTGKAGMVVFADTSGLHRGGYATGRERIMSTAGFYSPSCPWPILFERPAALPETLVAHASDPAVRFALTAPLPRFSHWLFRRVGRSFSL